jgi:hypothetical protein
MGIDVDKVDGAGRKGLGHPYRAIVQYNFGMCRLLDGTEYSDRLPFSQTGFIIVTISVF